MHPWRPRLERILGPLARRSPLSANAITVIALVMNLAAAVTFALAARDARLFLLVPLLVGVAGLLDALDGLVARFKGTSSRFGDFLDHLCDRISDSALVAGWTIGAGVRIPLAVFAVLVVSLAGYVGTQVEATFRIREYDGLGRGEFVLAMFTLPLAAFVIDRVGYAGAKFAGLTITESMTAVIAAFALLGFVQRVRRAIQIANAAENADA